MSLKLNYSVVKITGSNAENFLQGQFTCDVSQVTEKNSALGALCNHQGRVLAIFHLFKNNNDYFCLLPQEISHDFNQHLTKYAIFSKVKLDDVTSDYGVYGLIDLRPNSNSLPTSPYQVITQDNQSIMLQPGNKERYLVWEEKKTDGESIIDADLNDWKLINILSGYPSIYKETMGVVTAHMLNLPGLNAISFTKGCYVGQEIIARTQYLGKSKRHLYRAELQGTFKISPGEEIHSEGQEAGIVIETALFQNKTMILAVLQSANERVFSINGVNLENINAFN